jgi:hypothetical protein
MKDNITKRDIEPIFIQTDELLEIIYDIYKEKQTFDSFCKENNEPRKSMSQFVFLYFRNKHESNKDTIQKTYNFINSAFINASNLDVSVFISILQNEIEEEFFGAFNFLKCKLEDSILKFYRKETGESSVTFENLLEETNGLIPYEVALKAVNQRYSSDHPFSADIHAKVNLAVEEAHKKQMLKDSMKTNSKMTRRERKKLEEEPPKFINYYDLERIIAKFEVQNHRVFLSLLSFEFKEFDQENYGFVDKKQFLKFAKGIFKKLGKKVDPRKMLGKVQGFDTSMITFSDVVRMFSKKKIKHKGVFMNLIEILNESLDQD